jgi:hypothetical protein
MLAEIDAFFFPASGYAFFAASGYGDRARGSGCVS